MDLKIVLKTQGNNYSAGRTPVRMESESETYDAMLMRLLLFFITIPTNQQSLVWLEKQ